MLGIIIFWIHYVVAAILLYHLLRCIYVKGESYKTTYRTVYKISDLDKRLKQPLFVIILLIIVFFIPVLNILVFSGGMCKYLVTTEGDSDYNKYYCKSFLTKKY